MSEHGYLGRCIGNYRIVASLGSGGFGSVYRSVHTILSERTVAIKILHTYLDSREECERFLQEARLLEYLHHPHILRILDVGIDERVPYLVAEFAPNGSLRDLIKRSAPQLLPVDISLSILSQVGEALEYAHQQHIVHRDLKPENILFDANGSAILADFGIAAELTTSSVKQVTVTGTPSYMAPEQFQGIASKESDQYALACIAYELVTRRAPFTAPDFFALGFKHLTEQPVPPTLLNPTLPVGIEAAILKAMSKQRGERYVEMRAFLAALQGNDGPSNSMAIPTLQRQQASMLSAYIPTLPNSTAPVSQTIVQASSPELYWHGRPHMVQQSVQETITTAGQGPVTPLPPTPISQHPEGDYTFTWPSPYSTIGNERNGGSALQEPLTPTPALAAWVPPTYEGRSREETGQAFPLSGGTGNAAAFSSARQRGAGRRKTIVAIAGGAVALAIVASLLFVVLPFVHSPHAATNTGNTTLNGTSITMKPSSSPTSHSTTTVGSNGSSKPQATPTSPLNPTPVSTPVSTSTPNPTSTPVISETLTVNYIDSNATGTEVSTQHTYSGKVRLTISGYGHAYSTTYSDAFYIYTDKSGNPLATPYTDIRWVLYINGSEAQDSVGLPAYNSSHGYIVTMNLSQPGTINFGIRDSENSDNSGSLRITVQQE